MARPRAVEARGLSVSMSYPIVPPEINRPEPGAILIVGRDPGTKESAAGRPFVGPSGELLFQLLGKHGIFREDCNITNRVLRQPRNDNFSLHSPEDVESGLADLTSLIDRLQPSVIIALGAHAAYDLVEGWSDLTGETSGGRTIYQATGILERRGFFWYYKDRYPVIPTVHPASCLYQPIPNRLLLEIDIMRVRDFLVGDLPRQNWPAVKRVYVASDIAPLWDSPLVAYDIEVKWGGKEFLCIAMYADGGPAYLAYNDALLAVRPWLESDRPKLCHNGQFDRYFLAAKLGIEVGGRHEDTIVAHWACMPELAGKKDTGGGGATMKSLRFLASYHLNVPWWKSYSDDPWAMGNLCCYDVAACTWIWDKLRSQMAAFGVWPQYERQMRKIPALIAVQRRGFLVDEGLRKQRIAALEERRDSNIAAIKSQVESYLAANNLTDKKYLWSRSSRCPCCNGGKLLMSACYRCLGLPDKKRSTLKARGLTPSDLGPCRVCEGRGRLGSFDFNPMSNQQLRDFLSVSGVPKYLNRDAQEDTIKRVLDWAANKPDLAGILSLYLQAKKDATILAQYERIAPDSSGVVRTVLSPVVTETGRLASSKSFVDPASTNLQNLTKEEGYKDDLYRVRDCLISRPGMSLVALDYDKAEAVVVAFESRNWDFYERLVSGEDVHRWVAAVSYHGGNLKAVTESERQRCKTVFYASLYMAGIRTITRNINAAAKSKADRLTEKEVESVWKAIMGVLHLDKWWQSVWDELMDPNLYGGVRWLENALGFRRLFYNPDNHALWKEAVNFFPQSTVASKIDQALIEVCESLEEPGVCEFLLQVHDELVFQIRSDLATDYAAKIREIMQSSFPARGRSVYIPCGCKIGTRWEAARKGEDPTDRLVECQFF